MGVFSHSLQTDLGGGTMESECSKLLLLFSGAPDLMPCPVSIYIQGKKKPVHLYSPSISYIVIRYMIQISLFLPEDKLEVGNFLLIVLCCTWGKDCGEWLPYYFFFYQV